MDVINDLCPPVYQKWVMLGGLILPYLTRAVHALQSGGGLRGVWRGIWFGTNQPKTDSQRAAEEARK